LIAEVAANMGEPKVKTAAYVEHTVYLMASALKRGEDISVRGFGSLRVRTRPARVVHVPRTGRRQPCGPRRWVQYRPAREVEEALNPPLDTAKLIEGAEG